VFNYNREVGYSPVRGTRPNIALRLLLAGAYIVLLVVISFLMSIAEAYVVEHYDAYFAGAAILVTLFVVVRYTFWPTREEHRHLRKLLVALALAPVLAVVGGFVFSLAARKGWLP
jgi:hypothetical protein